MGEGTGRRGRRKKEREGNFDSIKGYNHTNLY